MASSRASAARKAEGEGRQPRSKRDARKAETARQMWEQQEDPSETQRRETRALLGAPMDDQPEGGEVSMVGT